MTIWEAGGSGEALGGTRSGLEAPGVAGTNFGKAPISGRGSDCQTGFHLKVNSILQQDNNQTTSY